MTPKEKAKELVDKYYKLAHSIEWTDKDTEAKAEKFNDELGGDVLKYWKQLAEQCALIAVENEYNAKIQAYNEMAEFCTDVAMQAVVYAQIEKEQVKTEIQKL